MQEEKEGGDIGLRDVSEEPITAALCTPRPNQERRVSLKTPLLLLSLRRAQPAVVRLGRVQFHPEPGPGCEWGALWARVRLRSKPCKAGRGGSAGKFAKKPVLPLPRPGAPRRMVAGGSGLELGARVAQGVLCAGLFLFAYLQLWLLLCGREKRLSFRAAGLFLGLLWAALRLVLCAALLPPRPAPLRRLPAAPRWLLGGAPAALRFAALALLALFLAQVIFKVKCAAEFNRYKVVLYLGTIFTSLLFLFVNLTCALLAHDDAPEEQRRWALFTRAVINDGLFILFCALLACTMCRLSKMASANVYLESKGTSVCQALLVGSVVILLDSSRAFYNLVAVAVSPDHMPSPFNYGWDNLKVREEDVSSEEYVVFGMVLFLWEFIPTVSIVLFFRAQRLSQNLAPAGMINSHSYSSRAYFFDNPRRYDSDDDLPRLGGGSISTPQSSGWYGSLTGSDICATIPSSAAPSTDVAPLLFTHGSLDSRHHHNGHVALQN
ncbi:integral membrane protein GPR137C isoform X2 [Anolis carolinensis]